MTLYEHPYRLDAVFVQHLCERLHGVRSTSPNHIPSEPEATPVFLVSVEELTTLINVAFWASFKKEEGALSPLRCSMLHQTRPRALFCFSIPCRIRMSISSECLRYSNSRMSNVASGKMTRISW
jgi:hypothetical protein